MKHFIIALGILFVGCSECDYMEDVVAEPTIVEVGVEKVVEVEKTVEVEKVDEESTETESEEISETGEISEPEPEEIIEEAWVNPSKPYVGAEYHFTGQELFIDRWCSWGSLDDVDDKSVKWHNDKLRSKPNNEYVCTVTNMFTTGHPVDICDLNGVMVAEFEYSPNEPIDCTEYGYGIGGERACCHKEKFLRDILLDCGERLKQIDCRLHYGETF